MTLAKFSYLKWQKVNIIEGKRIDFADISIHI